MAYDPRFQARLDEIRATLLQIAADHRHELKYYKRRWEEDRGDDYAAWGCSDWYFEVSPDGSVIRQMEIFDNGTCLQYHADRIEDTFGGLTDQEVDLEEFRPLAITREEFEAAWSSHTPLNRD